MMVDNFFFLVSMLVILTLIIFYIGDKLAFYADQLSIVTNISGAFIGFVLIAVITSIPEMVSTLVAISQGYVDLAVGGVLGSNSLNLSILSIVFLIFGTTKIQIESGSVFSFLSSLILLALFGLFMTADSLFELSINKFVIVGIFVLIYIFIMKHSYELSSDNSNENQQEKKEAIASFGKIVSFFILCSIGVVVCSWLLVYICKNMTLIPVPFYNKPLGEQFIGSLLLAFATSIPELATTIQIVRRGYSSMAIENISGSNICNIMFLVISSIFKSGSFWNHIPLNSLYTIFLIFIASLLLCIISFVKNETTKIKTYIYYIVILLWIFSLILVF